MSGKIVYQTDAAGWYVCPTTADECEFVPGTFHIPAGCVEVAPPVPPHIGMRARWDGRSWSIQRLPLPASPVDEAAAKLAEFLSGNPDVMALLNKDKQ